MPNCLKEKVICRRYGLIEENKSFRIFDLWYRTYTVVQMKKILENAGFGKVIFIRGDEKIIPFEDESRVAVIAKKGPL